MRTKVVEISSEEAAALLTYLEYYVLYDLQNKDNHQKWLQPGYAPVPEMMAKTLNHLREKLLPIVKG